MLKVHYQTDQAELFKACGGHMFELIETETGVKSAASDLIGRDIIEKFRPDDDHFLVHCIAMGDTETYGPNKNADGWSKEALEKKHQTFVTNGHFFREHRNRDPKQKIGDIKYAAFDGSKTGMHRVELLCWGHKKKAEEEYQMAKEGKELSFSMSARVPYDVCNCCHNKAASRAQYCEHMLDTPLQYLPAFRKYAFVDNPDPDFFDNSRVKRPADRIARHLEIMFPDADMRKAAHDQNRVILGVDWAEFEGLAIPDQVREQFEGQREFALKKLAALEQEIEDILKGASATSEREVFIKGASETGTLGESFSAEEVNELKQLRPGTLFRELGKRSAILPFETFFRYLDPESKLDEDTFNKAASFLPGIMRSLLSSGGVSGLCGLMEPDEHYVAEKDPFACKDQVQELMDRADCEFGVRPHQTKPRMLRIRVVKAAKKEFDKKASDEEARVIAEAYGMYQMEALRSMEDLTGEPVGEREVLTTLLNNRKY